jgi:hypothetical protein
MSCIDIIFLFYFRFGRFPSCSVTRFPDLYIPYRQQLFNKLKELREARELTNVVIIAGEDRILCHKVVVAALSPRIKQELILEPDTEEILLDDVEPQGLAEVLNNFYAGIKGRKETTDVIIKQFGILEDGASNERHSGFYSLLKEGVLTDLTLTAEGESLRCHKVILAAASAVFRAMLTSDMKESSRGEVNISGISFSALRAIVGAVYGEELELDGDNVQEILMFCHQYEM